MRNGVCAGFKYFDFDTEKPHEISVVLRDNDYGQMNVYTKLEPGMTGKREDQVSSIMLSPSSEWTEFHAPLSDISGKAALFFQYSGKGHIDFRSFLLQ